MTFAELELELHKHAYTLSIRFVETHYIVRVVLDGKVVGASASDSLESAITLALNSTKMGGRT